MDQSRSLALAVGGGPGAGRATVRQGAGPELQSPGSSLTSSFTGTLFGISSAERGCKFAGRLSSTRFGIQKPSLTAASERLGLPRSRGEQGGQAWEACGSGSGASSARRASEILRDAAESV